MRPSYSSSQKTVCLVPQKNTVGPTAPSVDELCEVKWSSDEVLTATMLTAGKYQGCVCW